MQRLCIALLTAGALGVASCAGGEDPGLRISAASSLDAALAGYAAETERTERIALGGSDSLAAQIRRGAAPDLFISAAPEYVERLGEERLVGPGRVIARNRVAIAVPAGSKLRRLDELAGPGIAIAIGAKGVPAGDAARRLLAELGGPVERGILANVRTEEPDVKGVVAKLRGGAADAGFVYATDLAAAAGELRELPVSRRITTAYVAAVVEAGSNPAAARAAVEELLDGPGARALRRAGFLSP